MDLTFLHGDDIMVYTIKGPYEGSIFGRLGRGIGQGINEQLPKEITKYRQAGALDRLAQSKEEFDPLKASADLVRGDFSPQEISQYLPMVQKQMQRKAFENAQNQQIKPEIPQINSTAPGYNVPQGKGGFASASQINAGKSRLLQEPDEKDVGKKALEILNSGETDDKNQALILADQRLRQSLGSQNKKLTNFDTGYDLRSKLVDQGKGWLDFKEVPGAIKQFLKDEGHYRITELGQNPEKVEKDLHKIDHEFAQNINKLNELGSSNYIKKKSATSSKSLLKELGEPFKKLDTDENRLYEQYSDMATAATKTTPMFVANALEPLQNKGIKELLDVIPKSGQIFGKGYIQKFGKESPSNNNKYLDAIIDNIKPEDNILSLEYDLRDAGINIDKFRDRYLERTDINKSEKQARQITKPTDNSWLGDIWFTIFK
jgi:hypothetical protein